MAKFMFFIVFKLMTSPDLLYSRELCKIKFKTKIGLVHRGVQGVVNGLGVSVFNSPGFLLHLHWKKPTVGKTWI